MWKKKLARCNPFNSEDKDIESASYQTMPKSAMVYESFRGKPIGEMDELSLVTWADGDAGKGKFPKLETQCKMVYVQKFGIPDWRSEDMTDEEIKETLLEFGFDSANYEV